LRIRGNLIGEKISGRHNQKFHLTSFPVKGIDDEEDEEGDEWELPEKKEDDERRDGGYEDAPNQMVILNRGWNPKFV